VYIQGGTRYQPCFCALKFLPSIGKPSVVAGVVVMDSVGLVVCSGVVVAVLGVGFVVVVVDSGVVVVVRA